MGTFINAISMNLIISSPADLDRAAREFLAAIGRDRHIAFIAPMGSGKTTFIAAICRALDMEEEATSPTFSIVNEYRSPQDGRIFHFDFYRVEDPAEIEDLGLDEYFDSPALCLMEWPEAAAAFLPDDTRFFRIAVNPDESRVISELDPD